MILDGKSVKLLYLENLKKEISSINEKLGLVVIQVGEDPASSIYVRNKARMANDLGFNFNHIKLSSDASEEKVLEIIDNLNNDDSVDGILVQLPLPKGLNSDVIVNRVSFFKDVDGLTDVNMGRLAHNKDCLVACTPMGIIDLLDYYNIDISGKEVVIVGRSNLVGKPLASLMTNKNATVSLCHSKTNNLKEYTKRADILVVAVGVPKFINREYIKEGAVVIDVGINRLDNGAIVGDVDFLDVVDKASLITPVPGGVGQMTVYELGKNVVKAHKLRKRG